jgi:hypothetical protein
MNKERKLLYKCYGGLPVDERGSIRAVRALLRISLKPKGFGNRPITNGGNFPPIKSAWALKMMTGICGSGSRAYAAINS